MKFVSKLNTTTKLLLLVLYVIVIAIIIFLAGNIRSDKEIYKDYGRFPGDENMDLAIRLKERRNAPVGSEKHEAQYWDLQIYLHLKDQKAVYRNVTIYSAILKKDGTMKFEEKTATILTGIENPNNVSGSTSDRGMFSSYGTTSKTLVYDSKTEEYTKNNGEPDKIYVKVVYEIHKNGEENERKSFTYQCDVVNTDEVNFSKYEKTEIKDSFIDLKLKSEAIKIKVRTTFAEEENDNDTYRLNIEYNPLDDDKINTVKDSKVLLFIKTKNTETDTDNYFSDYVEFSQFYGALPYLYSIPQVNTSYNELFEGEELYVYTEINKGDGTSESSQIYIPINDLPEYK